VQDAAQLHDLIAGKIELEQAGELCIAISPATNLPMGVFPVQAYNPYTETDMDQDDGDKKATKVPWWKFWNRNRDKD